MRLIFCIIIALFAVAVRADDKITYADHVLPVFRNSCLNCHNPDKKKGGLDLSSYAGALGGGGSGKAIEPGDADGSLLYRLITHADEPSMPPKGKLGDKEIETIKEWIAGGLLETSGSAAIVSNKPKLDLTVVATAGKPDGPPPMPGDLLLEPPVHTPRAGAVLAIASSPWAPLVAVGGQKQVLLYNPQTRELLGVLPFPEGFPNVLRFSRSGKLLLVAGGVGAKSGKAVLFDVASGSRVTEVGDELDSVLAADISPDQSLVALGGPAKIVKIFSTANGAMVAKISKHTDWITAVAFSPDGKLLATGDRNGSLFVWESQTANEVHTLAGHKAAVTSARFRGDSSVLATSGEDNDVKLWDMSAGKQIKNIAAHPGGVLSVDFAPDGRLVTAGRDNRVKMWKPDGGTLKTFTPFDDIALHACFDNSNGGKLVIGADWTGVVRVFDAGDAKPIGTLDPNPSPIAERISQASPRLAELQAEAGKLRTELDAAGDRSARTVVQKQQIESKLASLDEASAAAMSKIASLEEAAKTANAARAKADEKHAEMTRLLLAAQSTAEPADQAAAFERANAAANEARQQADFVQKAFSQINADADTSRKILADVQSAKPELQTQHKQIAERAGRITAGIERLKPRVEKAADDVADFQRQIARLQAGQFFTQVYVARETLRQRQSEVDAAAAELQTAQAATEKAVADVPVFEKQIAEFPQRIAAAEKAIPLAEQTANAAANVLKGIVAIAAEREAFVKQANESAVRIADLAGRDPANKLLADAATAAKSAADLLATDLSKLQEGVKAQQARAATAAQAVADARVKLEKEKQEQQNAPQTLESLRAAIPAAQSAAVSKKTASDTAVARFNESKSVTDRLDAEYTAMKKQLGVVAQN